MIIEHKKSAQNIWSKDPVHEKTFLLSSRTPFGYLLTSCPEKHIKNIL